MGLWLYRKLGYAPRAILLPAFDRQVLNRLLGFGARLTLGALTSVLSSMALTQILPTDAVVPSPWMLLLAYEVLAEGLYAGLMPAIAEAHVQGYRRSRVTTPARGCTTACGWDSISWRCSAPWARRSSSEDSGSRARMLFACWGRCCSGARCKGFSGARIACGRPPAIRCSNRSCRSALRRSPWELIVVLIARGEFGVA